MQPSPTILLPEEVKAASFRGVALRFIGPLPLEARRHWYCGRFTCHYKPGQPELGNPFKIGQAYTTPEGKPAQHTRESAIAAFRKHLWVRIRQEPALRKFLRSLPSDAVLYCHCAPKSCHCDVIAAAATWLNSPEGRKLDQEEEGGKADAEPPYSNWRILFGATCWIDLFSDWWQSHPMARYHVLIPASTPKGATIRKTAFGLTIKHEGRQLANLHNMPFAEVPAKYLDWLLGQPWVFPQTANAIAAYLSHPRVQAELEEQLPRADVIAGPGTVDLPASSGEWVADDSRKADRWHGQPIPEAPDDRPWTPMKLSRAWQVAADFCLFVDSNQEPADLLEVDFEELRQAVAILPAEAQKKVRAAYATWREGLRRTPARTDQQVFDHELACEALREMLPEGKELAAAVA